MKIEVRYLKLKTNGLTCTYYEEVEGIEFYDDHTEIKQNAGKEDKKLHTVTKIPKGIISDTRYSNRKRD